MASPYDATESSDQVAKPGRWRFSLRTLFVATTLCGLAMFAVVRFGPIAAARDIGLGLSCVFALWALAAPSAKKAIAAVSAAVVGLIPTVVAAGAPFSNRSAVCCECGMDREIRQVCGRTTMDEIHETDASHWVAPLVPAGHRHVWTTCSLHQRTHWFGIAPIGCGGPREGAIVCWHLAHEGDQAAAEQAYQEYQDIVTGRSSKSMVRHRQELETAIAAAHQARQRP